MLFTHCFWRTVPYARFLMFVVHTYILNVWLLLTHSFRRSAPYAMLLMLVCQMRGCFSGPSDMFLMLIFQMSGCYLRTAFGAVLRTLCSLCLYVKCVGGSNALLLAQCSLHYVRYAPYTMFLMLVCQLRGCYLRTAFRAVFLTVCSLCLYVKCVGAAVLLTLRSVCL